MPCKVQAGEMPLPISRTWISKQKMYREMYFLKYINQAANLKFISRDEYINAGSVHTSLSPFDLGTPKPKQ